jgi:hypothetical protein
VFRHAFDSIPTTRLSDAAKTGRPRVSNMANSLTLYSKDRKWKVDMNAWKTWVFLHASIGSQAFVYLAQETKDIWGNTVTDWVGHAATIEIINIYKGVSGTPQTSFEVSETFPDRSGVDLKLTGWGFLSISLTETLDPRLGPQLITLNVDSVDAAIRVTIPGGEQLIGKVSADSAFSDNSLWG